MLRSDVYALIDGERESQDRKFGGAENPNSILPGNDWWKKLAVLGEEVGEVNNAVLEHFFTSARSAHLRAELVQVAAVAVAWLESDF